MPSGVIPPRKAWYKKFWIWIIILMFLAGTFLTAARLALNPILRFITASSISRLQGYTGKFEGISFSILHCRYVIENLRIYASDEVDTGRPVLQVERAEASFEWGKLLGGKLVADLFIDKPIIQVTVRDPEEKRVPAKSPSPNLAAALREVMPFTVARIAIRDAEMRLTDVTLTAEEQEARKGKEKEKDSEGYEARLSGAPHILVQGIEATVENIRTRSDVGQQGPTRVFVRATVERSGKLTVFLTADLLSEDIVFSGEARLVGLDLTEMNPLIEKESGLKVISGTFDLFASFTARNGEITGGVKPLLKNAHVEKYKPGILQRLKAFLVDTTLDIFSNRVPGKNAVGAVIPIQGKITNPNAEILPTILSVLRNAFVEGLTTSLTGVPPPQASEPQGPVEQVQRAFTPSPEGGQPLAQPQGTGTRPTPSVPPGNPAPVERPDTSRDRGER